MLFGLSELNTVPSGSSSFGRSCMAASAPASGLPFSKGEPVVPGSGQSANRARVASAYADGVASDIIRPVVLRVLGVST